MIRNIPRPSVSRNYLQNAIKLNENTVLVRRWDLRVNDAINPSFFKLKPGNYLQIDTFSSGVSRSK
jgi:hypothetical protein